MASGPAVNHIQGDLRGLEWGLTKECIDFYCNQIREKAAESCGVGESHLDMKAISDKNGISIAFSLDDKDKLACVISVIEQVLPSIPITGRMLFGHLLLRLQR
jgi:hypothetical protein